MGSLGMLFYVVECFTVNLEEFAADTVGSLQIGGVDQEVEGDGRLVAVAFSEPAHEVHKVGALYAEGAEVGDHVAELGGLVTDGLLKIGEAGNGIFGRGGYPAAEDIELNFDGEEGLEDAVVKVAGDAAALAFDGSGA